MDPILSDSDDQRPQDRQETMALVDAYTELQNLLLDQPDVTNFLRQLAVLAAAIVPATHCGITMRRDKQIASVASSDDVAMQLDEIQYLRGYGPCLQAVHTGERVEVPDVAKELRWNDYRTHALAAGVRSVVSLPLTVNGATIGALNLFSGHPHSFSESDIQRAESFTQQAATALTILLRQASKTALDDQVRDALATRAVIDQAMGILMATRRITSTEAFDVLRHTSQNTNRKLSEIAAELITKMTGHQPQPPNPLTHRS